MLARYPMVIDTSQVLGIDVYYELKSRKRIHQPTWQLDMNRLLTLEGRSFDQFFDSEGSRRGAGSERDTIGYCHPGDEG